MTDARANSRHLVFGDDALGSSDSLKPVAEENIVVGEVSEAMCAKHTPCHNNSTCTDVFYSDYRLQYSQL